MSAYSDAVLALSPLGYWRLGETSGTAAADASGNGHNGVYTANYTLNGAGALVGDADPSVYFPATHGRVQIPYSTSLDLGKSNGPFTIMGWTKLDSTPQYAGIFSQWTGTPYLRWSGGTDNKLHLLRSFQADIVGSSTAHTNTGWHFAVVTYAGSNGAIHFYVDAVDESTTSPACNFVAMNASNSSTIGADNPGTGDPLLGYVDEVAVFGSALSGAAIANLYQLGLGHFVSPTLTGAGVATVVGQKAASAALTLTGAGTATLAAAKGAKSAQALTGAGVATVAQSTARAGVAALTGAGTATAATQKGAQAAPAVTGAGVLTSAVTTARSVSATATGAGVATITATAASLSEAHSGSAVMTGAGSAIVAVQTARSSVVTATGAGAVTASIASARFGAAVLSGGGVLTDSHSTARAGAVTGTGAGVVTVDAIAAIPLGLAARMRIASESIGMRIASVSDVPTIRRAA